jgi:Acid sphingomyelin phosphodiesterase C-terminal region
MTWNYQLLSTLWQQNGWLDNKTASYASTRYGAYAVNTKQAFKVISINTDFYYTPNVFNYFNYTNPDIDFNAPLNVAWVGPSIAPRTNYNAGWSVYQVDAKTFSVVNSQTYFANISNSLTWTEPKWELEYDARATYDPQNNWPATAPLNATFWDQVTTRMKNDSALLDHYLFLETKSNNQVSVCTNDACRVKAICMIRSGSAAESALCSA